MPLPPAQFAELHQRMAGVAQRARALEADGLPVPTAQLNESFEQAIEAGNAAAAEEVVKRGDLLVTRINQDWVWIRELLRRADELRAIAQTIGVDLSILDTRVGNPRNRLQQETLSTGSLQKAAASASLALAVLNDTVPKFCVQEAQKLGQAIRKARDRGEETAQAAAVFQRLLIAIQDQNLPTAAQRLVETRRMVARIPRAPALPPSSPNEEEEILLEARNLARRLHRIKGKARDAQSAARLMSQVRALVAEDRRYGTPEEEIETLWLEVDRLTRDHRRAQESPPETSRQPDERRPSDVVPIPERGSTPVTAPPTGNNGSSAADSDEDDQARGGYSVPYMTPELPPLPDEAAEPTAAPPRPRPRPRERP